SGTEGSAGGRGAGGSGGARAAGKPPRPPAPEPAHQLHEGVASLSLADQEKARFGPHREEAAEGLEERLVPSPRGESCDAAEEREARRPELLAHLGGARRVGSEARHIDNAVMAMNQLTRGAAVDESRLDAGAHRYEGVASAVERGVGPRCPHRPLVVEAAHESGASPAPPAEPVIVAVMRVHDVDSLSAHEGAQAAGIL